jgi:hypothetical protein
MKTPERALLSPNMILGPAPLQPRFKLDEPIMPQQIAACKRMSFAQKFQQLENMHSCGVAMKVTQLRRRYPHWSDEELEREARRALMYAGD